MDAIPGMENRSAKHVDATNTTPVTVLSKPDDSKRSTPEDAMKTDEDTQVRTTIRAMQ